MLEAVATGIRRELDRANEIRHLHFQVLMRTVSCVSELRAALQAVRADGRSVGLVPTMGALHGGHLSLIERARAECDTVVVSLFVNPAQFNEPSDLDRYPRRLEHDELLAGQAGADLLFAPSPEEVYPEGFATTVQVDGLTDRLEGAVRGAAHFHGVTTVVAKLLNMVGPDAAYFGRKDAQQLIVIRRMVADLNMPVRIVGCPTVRERDGLAMSSRNAHLSPEERERATALYRALAAGIAKLSGGERSADAIVRAARAALEPCGVQPEYLELVDPDTLEPLASVQAPALLAIAARIGKTRLIDNAILNPTDSATDSAHPHPSDSREALATCSV